MEERYYKHDLMERVTHWALTLSCIFLILSGFQIAFPSVKTGPGFNLFGSLNGARFVHFVSMYVFAVAVVVWGLYQLLILGRYRTMWPYREDWRNFIPTVKYYLFLAPTKPEYEKYNPLQRLTYLLLLLLAVLESLWGFGLYWQQGLWGVNELFGGILNVRALHRLATWFFLAFLIVHVYLIFIEDIRSLWGMIHGYGYRKVPEPGR